MQENARDVINVFRKNIRQRKTKYKNIFSSQSNLPAESSLLIVFCTIEGQFRFFFTYLFEILASNTVDLINNLNNTHKSEANYIK